ncbi:MAG: hypothetical protein GY811_30200 [Myxococcales bacterium]|nr:hypothetical protein [Myxococcales bacterium]
MRTWVSLCILMSVSLTVAYVLYRRVSSYAHPDTETPKGALEVNATAPEQGLRYGEATLRYLGPLGVLHTKGSVAAVGTQHGRLLARQIDEVQRSLQSNVTSSVSSAGLFGSRLHTLRLRWRWRTLDDGIPGHQLVELAALARGAEKSGVSLGYENIVRQSAVFDVGAPVPQSPGAEIWTITRGLTLIAPLASELGNRLVVTRTLALPGLLDGGEAIRQAPILYISHPEKALAHASLGYPGLVGVHSGVNSESLGVFLHNLRSADVRLTREAQPASLLAREVLEHARSIDEAIAILRKATILGSAVFVLVDGNTRKWAVVERSPDTTEVRKGEGSAAIVDTFEGSKFKEDPMLDRSRRTRPMLLRQERARQLLRRPHANVNEVAAVLRDQRSSTGSRLTLGHRAAIDDPQSVQSAMFDLSSMVLWVSETGDASGAFRAIDLRHEIDATSARAAPPPDIEASEESQGERHATREARHFLVRARKARNSGKRNRAREFAASALARSPSLPEALLLAGQLAQDDDDELAGRAFLQRFLELGADDLRAREQAEAWLGR